MSMATHEAAYDRIGDRYSEAKTAPWRLHLEANTLERLAGDVRGARVLDAACGDGFYSRRLARRGAALTVGVDASAEMVGLGDLAERREPLGCRYLQADVADMGVIGSFDLVVAAFLLNYARTRDELDRFCRALYANLRPGGRLVGVNDYTDDGITGTRAFERHGFRKVGPTPYAEGRPIAYEFALPAGRSFAITNYYWRPETYVEALANAGFRDARWVPFEVASEASASFQPGFFGDLVERSPMAAFAACR
ncbi:MAG TPA: methyltransferase domain-containing protein [Candidatus Binatia bacterium]|nr:methyltransferase domain-containing protein [Candidatus Binatia bacterium]